MAHELNRTTDGDLACMYGSPWLDHFAPPLGTGKGCVPCAANGRPTPPTVSQVRAAARANKSGEKWQMTGKTRLQQVWVWPDTVVEFVRSRLHGDSLNVCAGKNPLCTVNLDLDPTDRTIIKGDMRLLPFTPDSFDVVVSDPPWKISYYERFRPFFECVRVCKVGGTIIYNANWIPMTPSGDARLDEVWARQDSNFTNVSIISIHTKLAGNPAYEAGIASEQAAEGWEWEEF